MLNAKVGDACKIGNPEELRADLHGKDGIITGIDRSFYPTFYSVQTTAPDRNGEINTFEVALFEHEFSITGAL